MSSWKSISVPPIGWCHMRKTACCPMLTGPLLTLRPVIHIKEVFLFAYCRLCSKHTGESLTSLAVWWRHCPAQLCTRGPNTSAPCTPNTTTRGCRSSPPLAVWRHRMSSFFFLPHLVWHVFPPDQTDTRTRTAFCSFAENPAKINK